MTICIEGINKLRFPVYTSCAKDIKQWLLDIEDLLLLSFNNKESNGVISLLDYRFSIYNLSLYYQEEILNTFLSKINGYVESYQKIISLLKGDSSVQYDASFIEDPHITEIIKKELGARVTTITNLLISSVDREIVNCSNKADIPSLTYNIMSIISSLKYEAVAIATTLVTNLLGIIDSIIFEHTGGIDRKLWICGESPARIEHFDNNLKVALLKDQFILSDGRSIMYPSDFYSLAGNIIYCKCFLLPILQGVSVECIDKYLCEFERVSQEL